jgi:hypothetical protein
MQKILIYLNYPLTYEAQMIEDNLELRKEITQH